MCEYSRLRDTSPLAESTEKVAGKWLGRTFSPLLPHLKVSQNVANKALRRSAPGRDRTCDQRIRNPLLYPLSYGCLSGQP
jgi:hypothetical protein